MNWIITGDYLSIKRSIKHNCLWRCNFTTQRKLTLLSELTPVGPSHFQIAHWTGNVQVFRNKDCTQDRTYYFFSLLHPITPESLLSSHCQRAIAGTTDHSVWEELSMFSVCRGNFWSDWTDCWVWKSQSWAGESKEANWARKVWPTSSIRRSRGKCPQSGACF